MVDTLLANLDRALASDVLSRLGLTRGGYGLVTLHRPANVDDPSVLRPVALRARRGRPALPARAASAPAGGASSCATSACPSRVRIIPPAGYLDFIALEASARLVLTDSGRGAGRDHGARRPLPDAAGQHRAPDHADRGHQPAGGPGSRADHHYRAESPRRSSAAAVPNAVGWACRPANRSDLDVYGPFGASATYGPRSRCLAKFTGSLIKLAANWLVFRVDHAVERVKRSDEKTARAGSVYATSPAPAPWIQGANPLSPSPNRCP